MALQLPSMKLAAIIVPHLGLGKYYQGLAGVPCVYFVLLELPKKALGHNRQTAGLCRLVEVSFKRCRAR